MAKVITFSRKFPSYHPKSGEPTYFVEAFFKSLFIMKTIPKELEETFSSEVFINGMTKHHTIRSGNRFKKGTMHIKFKDLNDWYLLNKAYGELKGFTLHEQYKK